MLRESLESVCVYTFLQRSLSTPSEYIRRFAEACVILIILYCWPALFPRLLKQDFALLRRSINLIRNVCGLSFSYLTNLVYERHIKACSDFAGLTLAELSKARSHTSTRSRFNCFPRRLQPTVTLFYRHVTAVVWPQRWSELLYAGAFQNISSSTPSPLS